MNAKTVHKKWVRSLPRSKMAYPKRIDDKLKYTFWRAFTPIHPLFRELCMPVRKLRGRSRRQDYLLGTLSPQHSVQTLVAHLVSLGYQRHRVAWRDPQEIVSLRLVDGFEWQYHLRIFNDGEVRGHYELTPESYPFKHLKKVAMQDRNREFFEQLDGWIVEQRT